MKFETVRKMDEEIKKFTSLEQLENEIVVTSQGTKLIFEKVASGKTMGIDNTFYMCNETADSFRVIYTLDGSSITVTETKLSRV